MTDHARVLPLDAESEELLAAAERGLREEVADACRRTAGGRHAEVRLVVEVQHNRVLGLYFTDPAPRPGRRREARRRAVAPK